MSNVADANLTPDPFPPREGEQAARYAWEQALLDDYSEHRWHQALNPLATLFARWSAGAAEHLEVSAAIARAYKQIEADFLFFSDHRATLIAFIQRDRAWYEPWLAAHPEPPAPKA